jgi:uncharacterized Zn-binding protein involved in type VI secretion
MTGVLCAAVGAKTAAGGAVLSFSGTFSSAGATVTVTSATRTITGTGTLLFNNLAFSDSATAISYSKNGGAFTTISEGNTLAMSNGDTLALRGQVGATVGSVAEMDLRDNSGAVLIEHVTFTRT